MLKITICVLVIALIIACLIIAKQNEMLREVMPIIDQLYKEKCGDDE